MATASSEIGVMAADDKYTSIVQLIVSSEIIINEMIGYFHEEYEQGNSPVDDFSVGSQLRNIYEGVTPEAFQLRWLLNRMLLMGYVKSAEGGFLDILGEEYNTLRYLSTPSEGELVFSDPVEEVEGVPEEEWLSVLDEPITIPMFTRVAPSKDSAMEYETLKDVTLYPKSSVTVPAECIYPGEIGNIARKKIDTIIEDNDELTGLTVINPDSFSGGDEGESDDYYRARILNNKRGNEVGKKSWYKSKTEDIQGVHDAITINMPSGRYTIGIIVNGNVKPTGDNLIQTVKDWFYQEENLVGGMDVLVKAASEKPVNFEMNIVVSRGYDPELVKGIIKDDLKSLINGGTTTSKNNYAGQYIAQELVMNSAYNVLTSIDGLSSFRIIYPVSNVTCRSDEVLVMGDVVFQT